MNNSFDLIKKGTAGIFPEQDLKDKLALGRPLRIKFGIDPTAPNIHLGHCVALRKLRQFQDMGHRVVLIIGDFTASIGDPTGRDKTRPILSKDDIDNNAKSFINQASKILDISDAKLETHFNSLWFDSSFSLRDFLDNIAKNFTAQQLWHRDSFKKRIKDGVEINLTEFLYPTFQSYDSVAINADVELGGTDQTFNLQRGRDLMSKTSYLGPQVVITMPILVGLDGKEKMSKSKGNHIGVTDDPWDIFGKVMSLSDNIMPHYFELLTDETNSVKAILENPMQAKKALAWSIVELLYNAKEAEKAQKEFERVFSMKAVPTNIEIKHLGRGWNNIVDIVMIAGFAPSKTQARRLIEAGAVKIDGIKQNSKNFSMKFKGPAITCTLQVGKRKFCTLRR